MPATGWVRSPAVYGSAMGDVTTTCPVCGSTLDDEAALNRHLEEHEEQPVQTE